MDVKISCFPGHYVLGQSEGGGERAMGKPVWMVLGD